MENTPDITSKQFRNISIITSLNIHKDEFNHIGTEQFTAETGQEIVHFYSKDSMTDTPASNARHKNKLKVIKLTAKLQHYL